MRDLIFSGVFERHPRQEDAIGIRYPHPSLPRSRQGCPGKSATGVDPNAQ